MLVGTIFTHEKEAAMELNNRKTDVSADGKLVWNCQYHVIWCVKYKRGVFNEQIMLRLKEIIRETASKHKFEVLECEVFESYVHLVMSVSPKLDIYKMVLRIKSEAQILLKEFPELDSRLPCLWSGTNFIYGVGEISLRDITTYIESQIGK